MRNHVITYANRLHCTKLIAAAPFTLSIFACYPTEMKLLQDVIGPKTELVQQAKFIDFNIMAHLSKRKK